jgi:hypothetical protein
LRWLGARSIAYSRIGASGIFFAAQSDALLNYLA